MLNRTWCTNLLSRRCSLGRRSASSAPARAPRPPSSGPRAYSPTAQSALILRTYKNKNCNLDVATSNYPIFFYKYDNPFPRFQKEDKRLFKKERKKEGN